MMWTIFENLGHLRKSALEAAKEETGRSMAGTGGYKRNTPGDI